MAKFIRIATLSGLTIALVAAVWQPQLAFTVAAVSLVLLAMELAQRSEEEEKQHPRSVVKEEKKEEEKEQK